MSENFKTFKSFFFLLCNNLEYKHIKQNLVQFKIEYKMKLLVKLNIWWTCWRLRPSEDKAQNKKGTYSQNSMTGEVAFSWWLMELFPLWNAIQESWMKERQKDIQCCEEIQAFSQVSKLHTGERNNATAETEEWNGTGAFRSPKIEFSYRKPLQIFIYIYRQHWE